eukprot:PITA_08711
MKRALMEKERIMLCGVELGQELCAEAVETACYLVNRSPSSMLEDKSPQEIWNGKKASLSHLRVFGYDAYVHVPKEKRTKLNRKSKRCIFIGEVKDVIKHEVPPKEPQKIEFELKEEESNSTTEEESEDEEPQTPAVRRLVQERRQRERYSTFYLYLNFSLSMTDDDPKTIREATNSDDGKLWKEAMVDEMTCLDKNEAWDLVELSAGRKLIGRKWVFKKKMNGEGEVEKYKDQLVEKGYS